MDRLTAQQRSHLMKSIRGKNTKPEMLLRRRLHASGFRYRLHASDLPGRPDLIFPRHRTAVFVNGCFWHGHECPMFKWPETRADYWFKKITANQLRDAHSTEALIKRGWRVLVVWECSLRGAGRWPDNELLKCCEEFILSGKNDSTEVSTYAFAEKGNSGS